LAVSQKNLEIIKTLICSGADISLANNEGISPLHQASYNGNIQLVDYLLNNGADKNLKTKDGLLAKDIAFAKKNFGVFELLNF